MGFIATEIAGVPVYSYGLLLTGIIIVGLAVSWLNLRLHHQPLAPLVDMLPWGIPLAASCGHAGSVLHHFDEYGGDLLGVLWLWQGGISFYGAMFGGLLAVFGVCRVQGRPTWRWLDLLAPGMVLMLALYEFGMFDLQMTMGLPLPQDIPNDHALVEYVEFSYRPVGFQDTQYFQPIALYQSGLQLLVCLLLIVLTLVQAIWRRPRCSGCLFLLGTCLVAFIRCGCGFFYLSNGSQGWLPLGRALSGGLGSVLLGWLRLRLRHSGQTYYREV